MDRRMMLKAGFGLGLTFIGERFSDAAEPRRSNIQVTFYSGTLTDGSSVWPLGIAVAAARAQANTYDPGSTDDHYTGYRMQGSLMNGTLTMTIFDYKDVTGTTPLGTATGTLRGTLLHGTFSLDSGGTGTFSVRTQKPNRAVMKQMAGGYGGGIASPPEYSGWSGAIQLGADGTWQLSQLRKPDLTPVDGTLAGYYAALPNSHAHAARAAGSSGVIIAVAVFVITPMCECNCCEDITPDSKDQLKEILSRAPVAQVAATNSRANDSKLTRGTANSASPLQPNSTQGTQFKGGMGN